MKMHKRLVVAIALTALLAGCDVVGLLDLPTLMGDKEYFHHAHQDSQADR